MKKPMMLTVMTVGLAAVLLFAGCSPKDAPAPAPDDSQTTQTPAETPEVTPETPETAPEAPAETPDAAQGQIGQLAALLGQDDAAVVEALGEGTASQDDAGAVTARDYEQTLYEKEVLLSVGFDGGQVSLVVAYATENEFDLWAQTLTEELGQPQSTQQDNADGGDTQELVWELDGGVMASLKDAYGSLSLELFQVA